MSVAGVRGPRGNGRPGHADPVEALALTNGDAGFGLQRTAAHYVQLPMVNPSAVVGAVLVDLSVLAGSLPSLMNNLIVQADFAARFAAARRFFVAGVEHIRWVSAILGGGGIDVPIEATIATVEHLITVREGLSVMEHCQTLDPGGIFVAASIHTDVSRMPAGKALASLHRQLARPPAVAPRSHARALTHSLTPIHAPSRPQEMPSTSCATSFITSRQPRGSSSSPTTSTGSSSGNGRHTTNSQRIQRA